MLKVFLYLFLFAALHCSAQNNIDDVLNPDLQKVTKGQNDYKLRESQKVEAAKARQFNSYFQGNNFTPEECINYLKSFATNGIIDCDLHGISFKYYKNQSNKRRRTREFLILD